MTRGSGNPTRTPENAKVGDLAYTAGVQSQRKGWRGFFALGVLLVTAAAGYGLMFVVIDKIYKGGSLGIL